MGGQAQAHASDGTETDTLDTRVVPVLFVPGVMGSRIDLDGAVSDWDPDDLAEMAGWLGVTRRTRMKDMRFNNTGTLMRGLDSAIFLQDPNITPEADIRAKPRLREIATGSSSPISGSRGGLVRKRQLRTFYVNRGWGEVVWSFYGRILIELEEKLNPGPGGALHPVHAVGYDWRQSNTDSAAQLDTRLNEVLREHKAAEKVIIVTHSMGGLVTRALMAKGGFSKIAGVLHNVMPADGAAPAYRRMFTGMRDELAGDGIASQSNFRNILGDNRLDYVLQQSVLRGPTELLPNSSYDGTFLRMANGVTNKFFRDIYAEYERNIPPGFMPREGEIETDNDPDLEVSSEDIDNLRLRLREASAFMKSISRVAHPETFVLFGKDQDTSLGVDFTKGTPTPDGKQMAAMEIRGSAGDGSVPEVSGKFPSSSPKGRDGAAVEHATCFQNAEFNKLVVDRVQRLFAGAKANR